MKFTIKIFGETENDLLHSEELEAESGEQAAEIILAKIKNNPEEFSGVEENAVSMTISEEGCHEGCCHCNHGCGEE